MHAYGILYKFFVAKFLFKFKINFDIKPLHLSVAIRYKHALVVKN